MFHTGQVWGGGPVFFYPYHPTNPPPFPLSRELREFETVEILPEAEAGPRGRAAVGASRTARIRGLFSHAILEFPEDLGAAELGQPASPFQLNVVHRLVR